MEDDDSWGLQAVVRSCGGATTTAAASSSSCSSSSSSSVVAAAGWTAPFFRFPPPWNPPPSVKDEDFGTAALLGDRHLAASLCRASIANGLDPLGELKELFRPFLPRPVAAHLEGPAARPLLPTAKEEEERERETKSPPPPVPLPTSVLPAAPSGACGRVDLSPAGRQPHASPRPRRMCHGVSNPRAKRRKNQVKKVVCQVAADALCSDMWAWRKYGQKPIKGSPFPRGYYRCSSSKGCPARKQVERSRTDPGMFVITYTSDHTHPVPTHRSCLAGSTRHKSPPPAACANPATSSKPAVSCSPLSSVEEELLLPVPEEAETGAAGGGDSGGVLATTLDEDDGLLLMTGMEIDDMLDGCVERQQETDDDDDGLLFSSTGFCSSPSPPGPEPEGGVCSWSGERDDQGTAWVPFAAASR